MADLGLICFQILVCASLGSVPVLIVVDLVNMITEPKKGERP